VVFRGPGGRPAPKRGNDVVLGRSQGDARSADHGTDRHGDAPHDNGPFAAATTSKGLTLAKAAATTTATAETREPQEGGDSPLLDTLGAGVKKMIAVGKDRGYVTYDDLNKALPPDQVSSEQIEDTMTMLSEMGINVVETEEAEELEAALADRDVAGIQDTVGNVGFEVDSLALAESSEDAARQRAGP